MSGPVTVAATETLRQVRRDAVRWVVRLASRRVTPAVAERFRRWHAVEVHAVAFARVRRSWEAMGVAAARLAPASDREPAPALRPAGTRRWLRGAGLTATTAGTAALVLRTQSSHVTISRPGRGIGFRGFARSPRRQLA
jgi:ferric-dicitrate binding protein FerR (iron transport regulator)